MPAYSGAVQGQDLAMRNYIAGKVSVIIPTFCEAGNVSLLVGSIAESFAGNGVADYEVIVVDDSSPDDTGEVCRLLERRHPFLRLVTRKNERGLATAIKRGIYESDGEIIVTMDADISHDPAVIPLLVKEIMNGGADVAIASRFVGNQKMHSSFHRVWGSRALNLFIRTLLQIPARDVTGGFHAIRRDALGRIDADCVFRGHGDYSFVLLYMLDRQGLKIKEIGYTYRSRETGASKTGFLKSGLGYIFRALGLRLGLGTRRRRPVCQPAECQQLH